MNAWIMDMARRRLPGLMALVMIFTVAVPRAAWGEDITISAAMSLKDAFTEMGRLYEVRHAGVRVRFNFGASGDLVRQIAGGAPVDVLAAASSGDMDDAAAMGLIDPATRRDFASNGVVVAVAASSGLRVVSFAGLASPGIGTIAVGNPRTTPIGRYTEDVLAYYGISDMVRARLVPVENVRQALDYARRGEVDAAVVYKTDAMARPSDVRVAAEARADSHKPISYPIAALRGAKPEGVGFVAFVVSREGQAVLGKYGFGPAGRSGR